VLTVAKHSEHGAALVTVVLFLPVLMLLPVFVIDVGNWFEHHRHLQLQADAGVLATAADFSSCLADESSNDTANARIEATAQKYAGIGADPYNSQVGGSSQGGIHIMLNSPTYYNQTTPTDDTVSTDPPCTSGMVDAKMTETDLPLLFRAVGLFTSVPFINTHARLEVFEKKQVAGAVPIGVPDPTPRNGWVQFFDQNTGSPGTAFASARLVKGQSTNGVTTWSSAASPVPLDANTTHRRIGVQVILSGDPQYTSSTPPSCTARFVSCYNDVLFVRDYATTPAGTPQVPQARSVTLTPAASAGCADPYFSLPAGTCNVTVNADVDFGQCNSNLHGTGIRATVTASPGGTLTQSPTSCVGNTSHWTGTVPVSPGAGPVPISLSWSRDRNINGSNCTNNNGGPCNGSFGIVQRTFPSNGTATTGPIKNAQVWEGSSFWANSVPSSTAHALYVTVGLTQGFEQNAQSVNAPAVHLAVVGNQNGHLDCDPAVGTNLADELAFGCPATFEVNNGTSCVYSPSAPPWNCVPLQTGGATGQVRQGMNGRIQGVKANNAPCNSPNHWAESWPNGVPTFDPADPRLITVFLTPYNSFQNTGNEQLPVTGFATFYITGYDRSPCSGDDPAGQDEVTGRFVKYVQSLNDGSGGDETCDFSALNPCVAVLTQ
jgi:Flp pilus assembly protein TadG